MKLRKVFTVLLVSLLLIFSLSCGVDTGEAKNVSAKVTSSRQLLQGQAGIDMNTQSFRIELTNEYFPQSLPDTLDVTDWITPKIDGITYSGNFI